MKGLLSITYQSRELLSDPVGDISAIVAEGRLSNRAHGVTSILCFDGNFLLHTIEGLPEEIETLFMILADDKRHEFTGHFIRELIDERDFSGWDMEFIAPVETVQTVPDMRNFPFSYHRLREVQATAVKVLKQKHKRSLN